MRSERDPDNYDTVLENCESCWHIEPENPDTAIGGAILRNEGHTFFVKLHREIAKMAQFINDEEYRALENDARWEVVNFAIDTIEKRTDGHA